jgi:hypothetical protein
VVPPPQQAALDSMAMPIIANMASTTVARRIELAIMFSLT